MPIISVRDIKKTYTTYQRGNSFAETMKSLFVRKTINVAALRGISFEVEQGELLGFLGPNGAGKSTMLKILTGVLFPTSGNVKVLGYTPWLQRKAYVSNIGAVFGQKSQLIWDIPPIDSFDMNRAIYSIPRISYDERLERMVDLLSVGDIIRKPTRQLSLGERMKCEFIMAMLHDPEIVFLDEPTIGLDVVAKERIREFILEMNSKGTTFILTTHDLDDIEHLAKSVIVVNSGEIVFNDTLDSLRKYSGARKLVNITTKKAIFDFSSKPGIVIKGTPTQYSAELELDTGVIELNSFIKQVNEVCVISDMTIEEPPIESVIKELYTSELYSKKEYRQVIETSNHGELE